jgi:signal peptidase II
MGHKAVKIVLIVVLFLINFGCDRITKQIARNRLRDRKTVQVAGKLVILRYTENRGSFLGLGSNLPEKARVILLTIIPALILAGMVVWLLVTRELSLLKTAALATVLGGGFGNIIDRMFNQGRVVDFMNIGIGRLRTGIFNAADFSIMFGMIFFIILLFVEKSSFPD